MINCRFCELKLQALKGFTILPSLAAVTIPRHDDLKYLMDDLPYPQSSPQELELWQVSIASLVFANCNVINNINHSFSSPLLTKPIDPVQ